MSDITVYKTTDFALHGEVEKQTLNGLSTVVSAQPILEFTFEEADELTLRAALVFKRLIAVEYSYLQGEVQVTGLCVGYVTNLRMTHTSDTLAPTRGFYDAKPTTRRAFLEIIPFDTAGVHIKPSEFFLPLRTPHEGVGVQNV